MPKTVNLLFDSVNDNTGDRAIGEVMLRFVLTRGAEPRVLDPEERPKPRSMTVVGGGELLHAPGDPFYEAFRLTGKHILNAVGVTSSVALEYLGDYAYVSVRSEADKALIEGVRPDVAVVPDVAMALDPVDPPEEVSPNSTVLVHAHSNLLHHCRELPTILSELGDVELRWISLTPYAADAATMTRIAASMDRVVPMSLAETPSEKLGAISRCKLLVCASFHGALFAYSHNVPFLVFARPPKVAAFLAERGLEARGFYSSEELKVKIGSALEEKVDFSSTIELDRRRLKEHFEIVADTLGIPKRARKKLAEAPVVRPKRSIFLFSFYKQALEELEHFGHQYRSASERQGHYRQEAERAQQEAERAQQEAERAQQEAERARQEAKEYALDRDRWKERALLAEGREAALREALTVLQQAEGKAAEGYLGEVAHQIMRLNEEVRHSTETRALQRVLKLTKRAGKAVWNRIPENSRQRLKPVLESAIGRPISSGEHTGEAEESPVDGSVSPEEGVARPPIRAAPAPAPALHKARRFLAGKAVVPHSAHFQGSGERIFDRSAGVRSLERVSILIPTKNAGDHLAELLRYVRCMDGGDEVEVVVVDSESTDGTPDVARSYGARVLTISSDEFNHGDTRNYLVSQASGEFVIFLTQDALPASPTALANLIAVLERDSEIAAASGRQIPRADADMYGAFSVFYHNKVLGLDRTVVFPEEGKTFACLPFVERRRWVAAVDNVCSAYRRDVLTELPFRNVRFGEDLDFAVRALQEGFKLAFCFEAPVIHSHDRSAFYHMRRHIADRTYLAEHFEDVPRKTDGGSKLATVALASAELVSLVDESLPLASLRGLSGCLEGVAQAVEHSTARPRPNLEALGRNTAREGKRWHEGELEEVYKALVSIAASSTESFYQKAQADAGTAATVSSTQLFSELALRLVEHLRLPDLTRFASANNWCGSRASKKFVSRLVGGLVGVFVGDAGRMHRESGPIDELLLGI